MPPPTDWIDAGLGYFACATNDDCVAVRQMTDCCYNGWQIAVAKDEAAQYVAATSCSIQDRHVCPEYFVQDLRVPACSTDSQCMMVPPPTPAIPASSQ